MYNKIITRKSIFYFLLGYLILWILLFDFILPPNEILPRPSIVFESFPALWTDYNLFYNFLSSFAAIYFSLLLGYFAVWSIRRFIILGNNFLVDFISSLQWFSKYIPGILLGLFLIYWFPQSGYIEFIFAFFTVFISIIIKVQHEVTTGLKKEYTDSAGSLGASSKLIAEKITWKSIEPELFSHIIELHFYLWGMLIIFEYIKGGMGLGVILRTALEYRDISGLTAALIIVGVIIFAGNHLLRFIKNKFIFWSYGN